MSRTQLKPFEGTDPEALIAQVREELGADARVVRGETFRSGGVLGFFAQERFRLLAEVPAGSTPALTRRVARPPRSGAAAAPLPVEAPAGSEPAEPAGPAASGAPPGSSAAEHDVFAMLAEETADRRQVSTPAGTTPAGTTPAGTTVAAQGPATQRPATAATGAADAPSKPTAAATDTTFADLLVQAAAEAQAPQPMAPQPVAAHEPALAPVTSVPDGGSSPLADALRSTGLPEPLVASVVTRQAQGWNVAAALTDALAQMEEAPPLPQTPGTLVVVIGTGEQARTVAASVAAMVGTDPAQIGLAAASSTRRATGGQRASLRACTAEDAAALAPGWRRSQVGVVAVEAPLAGAGRNWAAHVVRAMRPTAVWGIADAATKPEDIAAWADAVGGIDALVLSGLDHTTSPATVLRSGIPVALLADQPATPARWAATIGDLLPDCR